jgi:hypothetical protein
MNKMYVEPRNFQFSINLCSSFVIEKPHLVTKTAELRTKSVFIRFTTGLFNYFCAIKLKYF